MKEKKLVVGMIGKAGSGKDTVGDYLVEEFGFFRSSLAAPLKACIKTMFMLDHHTVYDREARELPLDDFPDWSVRKLLQFVGTELFRNNFDQDVWVKLLKRQIRQCDLSRVVVTDVRFPNELNGIKKMEETDNVDVKFIKVIRNGVVGVDVGIKNHESEAHDLIGDFIIENNGTIDDLKRETERIMKTICENR
jgi:hypothetical protein